MAKFWFSLNLSEIGDVDTNLVTLKFSSGAMGTIDNSRNAVYGYDQRLEVFCSNGVAIAGNESENTVIKGNPDGFHSSRIPHFFMQRYAPCYVDEVRKFIERSVKTNPQSPTDMMDVWLLF